jgi:hypothetical protein
MKGLACRISLLEYITVIAVGGSIDVGADGRILVAIVVCCGCLGGGLGICVVVVSVVVVVVVVMPLGNLILGDFMEMVVFGEAAATRRDLIL